MMSVEDPGSGRRGEESRPRPGAAEEALRRLEQRLDQASEAAERIISEAASEAAAKLGGGEPPQGAGARAGERVEGPGAGGGAEARVAGPGPEAAGAGAGPQQRLKPPPAGWQMPHSEAQRRGSAADLDVLVQLLRSLRDLIPPELQRRLAAALREVLLALRALIDWYLERLEQQREKPVEVEDIPIL